MATLADAHLHAHKMIERQAKRIAELEAALQQVQSALDYVRIRVPEMEVLPTEAYARCHQATVVIEDALRGSSDASSKQTLHGPIRVRDESRSDPSAARDYSNQDDIDKINASLRKHGDAIKQLVEDVEDLQDCIEVITAKEEEEKA